MRRALVVSLLVALCSTSALAGEGVFITIDAGYGLWGKDKFKERLSGLGTDPVTGLPNNELLVGRQMPDGGLFGLHLGYNVGGHVAFEGSLTVRPYDILADTRGGAGLAGLAARWYPLQGLVRPNRQFDISFIAGMDYVLSGGNGIHGPTSTTTDTGKIANSGRGFDGTAVELGATLELYPAKWVSLGVTPRWYIIDPTRYFVNFDQRETTGSIPLGASGSLSMYSVSVSVSFHFEPQPD